MQSTFLELTQNRKESRDLQGTVYPTYFWMTTENRTNRALEVLLQIA